MILFLCNYDFRLVFVWLNYIEVGIKFVDIGNLTLVGGIEISFECRFGCFLF